MIRQRNFELDLVRAIAILLVLFNHVLTNILHLNLGTLWYLAYLGVDIFFALSGFLIGGILLRTCNYPNSTLSPRSTLIFLVRRWFRTIPLYIIALLLNYTFSSRVFNEIRTLDWHYFICVQSFNKYPLPFFGESWSLCIEEWFYFSFAILLCIYTSLVKKWDIDIRVKVLLFTFFYILCFTLIRILYADYDYSEYKIVLFRLDSIAYGVLFAILNQYSGFKSRNGLIGSVGIILTVGGALLFLSRTHFPSLYILYYNLSGLGISLCVFCVQGKNLKVFNVFRQIVVFISKVSYSIYLINLLCIHIVLHLFNSSISKYILAIFSLTFIMLCSYLTYWFIELPFLNIRDKYFAQRHQKNILNQFELNKI